MKWFFALNQSSSSFEQYCVMAKVAVLSARKHTDLEPVLLFDGDSLPFIEWMQNHQVLVIQMEASVTAMLKKVAADRLDVGRGAFLRVDIPWVMDQLGWEDPFVLYTDCDVLFLKPIDFSSILPKYFAVAPEIEIDDYLNMNTGVMVMNMENLKRTYDGFIRFTMKYLNHFAYLDYDQTAYRCYYHTEWDRLSPQYNWKPYWGMNDEAYILHFHGAKPTEKEAALQNILGSVRQKLVVDPFFKWTEIWEEYAQAIDQDVNTTAVEKGTLPLSLNPSQDRSLRNYRVQSSAIQQEDQLDYLNNAALQQSVYRQYAEDKEGIDWRAAKGAFTLWVMYHSEDFEAQMAFSDFFRFLDQLENEYIYLVFAYRLNPSDRLVLKRLGVNLFRRGYFGDAQVVFEALVQQEPNDLDGLLSLAKVCTELKQYPKALEWIEKAYSLYPSNQDVLLGLEVIRQKMQKGG